MTNEQQGEARRPLVPLPSTDDPEAGRLAAEFWPDVDSTNADVRAHCLSARTGFVAGWAAALRLRPAEQHGDPVCVRCEHSRINHAFGSCDFSRGGLLTCNCVAFEPAPPSSEEAEAYVAPRWSAGDSDPEASELHTRAARAREELRRMCEGDSYLVITDLEDAVRTLARRPLEEERDQYRDWWRTQRDRAEAAEAQVARLTEERDRALDERDEHAIWANELSVQVAKLREALGQAVEGVIWMSGSADFALDGQAGERWRDIAKQIPAWTRALAETSERDGS